MDILSKLSERLNDLMNEAEIKTPELSEKTGIDQSAIARILRAERMPSLNSLTIIADFFHCSTDYLLGLSDTLDEKTFAKRPPFNEQLTYLLKHFNISKYRLEKETKLTEETVNRWHKGKNMNQQLKALCALQNTLTVLRTSFLAEKIEYYSSEISGLLLLLCQSNSTLSS